MMRRWLLLLLLSCPLSAEAYLTDKDTHTEPTAPSLPSAGSIAVDPTFGATIMRLTDSNDSATDCNTGYANQSAFNNDNTYVRAVCRVSYQRLKVWNFNATTLARSNGRIQANPPAGGQEYGAQWSRTTYNKFFILGNKSLYEVTIPDGASTTWTNTTIRNFSTEVGGTGSDYITQMTVSDDDDVFCFTYTNNSTLVGYIVYKRSTNTILLQVNNEGTLNEVEVDKSGRYLVALKANGSAHVWDLQGTPTRTTITTENFNHRAMGNGIVVSACSSNRVCKRSLATPNTVTYLLPSGWSYTNLQDHFSLTGTDSWMLGSRYKSNGQNVTGVYDNENVEVSTSGDGAVRRHVHNRSNVWGGDYDAQPKASVSLDGRFMAWTSNWDGANTSSRNDVYLAVIGASPPLSHDSCVVEDGDASTLRITFDNETPGALLPATAITGFTARKNGSTDVVTAAVRQGNNQVYLTLTDAIASDEDTIDYSYNAATGNVTDAGGTPGLANITNQSCTNNVSAPASATLTQTAFRWHGLYGSEAAPVTLPYASAPENTPVSVVVGGSARIRLGLACSVANCSPVEAYLRYSKNGGSYTLVPDIFGDDHVKLCGSSTNPDIPSNRTPTTEQLSGSEDFIPGILALTASTSTVLNLAAGEKTEHEFCVSWDSEATPGDTYDFRLYTQDGSALSAYSVTGRATIMALQASGGF